VSGLPYRTPDAPPKTRLPLLGELTIKTPCKVAWESMEGDERRRNCSTCSKDVYDLSAMTEDEAESFLAVHLDDDDLCVRLYRRPDGRILTSDCPTGAKTRHQRRVAAAASVAAVAITAVASAAGDLHVPRAHSPLHGSSSRFEPPRLLPGAPARLSFPPPEVVRSPLEGIGQGFGNANGHIVGYALGGIGSAADRTRAFPRSPTLRQGAVESSAGFPPEVVTRIVRQNFGRFRLCYEDGLRRDPERAGQITTRFVIGRDGSVASATDAGSDLGDEAVIRCVVTAFGNIRFPVPEQGAVIVKFPILLSPGD